MIEAVLFDVNHTLIGMHNEAENQSAAVDVLYGQVAQLAGRDVRRAQFRTLYDAAWAHGKKLSDDRYEESRYEDVVSWVLAELDIALSESALEQLLQIYMEPLYDASYAIPGMLELIDELRLTRKVGVVTNYKYASGMRGLLRAVGLDSRLDVVAISADVGVKKPGKRIYEYALEALASRPQDAVVVGNELEKDLWQARNLGCSTVLFESAEHESHDREFAETLRARLQDVDLSATHVARDVNELRSTLLSMS